MGKKKDLKYKDGKAYNDSVMSANRHIPFINRIINNLHPRFDGFPKGHEAEGQQGSHYMASFDNNVIPMIQEVDGELVYMEPKEAIEHAYANDNVLTFKTNAEADEFARNYKDSDYWEKFENTFNQPKLPEYNFAPRQDQTIPQQSKKVYNKINVEKGDNGRYIRKNQ